MKRQIIWLGAILPALASCSAFGQQLQAPVNTDATSFDSHPAMAVADAGEIWIAWHSYADGKEHLQAVWMSVEGSPRSTTVMEEGAVHGPPQVVADVGDSVWLVWSARRARHWQIVARQWLQGQWQPVVEVSDPGADAIHAAATKTPGGELIVAWSRHQGQRFTIQSRRWNGSRWSEVHALSSGASDAFRPTLAALPTGSVWAFWDEYDLSNRAYSVQGRQLLQSLGQVEQVSPAGQYCLQPTALAADQGLFVAWLRKQDVIGGPGVISQWHTLHAAVRREDGWKAIADDQGGTAAAELTQGLMAKIEPRAVATGGYLGRRTTPMLLADGERVWLLWERKADHRGSTATVTGDLVAREIRGGMWGAAVVVCQELLDYHLAHPPCASGGQFDLAAASPPRQGRRTLYRLRGDLRDTSPFRQDDWAGWQPAELPVRDELTPRREIRAAGRTFKLWWADLHSHCNLSADAEGEPDELTFYARDRGQLDAVLLSDNDYYLVPMTQHEYLLGSFFARALSQPGRFLSLQGYEWTSRIPGDKRAALSDPGNWTPPYQNRSYPNHRTVIYPDSGGPILRFPEVGNDIGRLHEAVRRSGGLTLTQHQVFQTTAADVEVGMEVTAGWGRYIESHPDSFHRPLRAGARLGFVANGDSHRRAPGLSGALTGIYAEELTTDAILDALRERRCFATNGSRIFIDARADGALMGREVTAAENRVALTLHAIGTRPFVSATLIRDGQEIKQFGGEGRRELKLNYSDENLSPGTHWYYWRVAQQRSAAPLPGNLMAAHGHLAWSTPHWVVAD